MIPFPNKKYNVIYADPPWKYNPRTNLKTRFSGGAGGHYSLMSIDEIGALPLQSISDKNCALFLWATFPYLDVQIKLFEHWGFKYKTVGFVWVKTNKLNGLPFFGVGYYTKSNAECCLLGIKGKMQPVTNRVSSIIISPRHEHSKKPAQARLRIVQLLGDLPRIELFARPPELLYDVSYEGWDLWGYEV